MLPHVAREQRRLALDRQRRAGVRRAFGLRKKDNRTNMDANKSLRVLVESCSYYCVPQDFEFAVVRLDQPRPARAKRCDCSLCEQLLECSKRAKALIDRLAVKKRTHDIKKIIKVFVLFHETETVAS
jgi:hypothetical protein